MGKFLDIEGLKTLWEKIKEKFASKAELDNKFSNLNSNYSNLESSLIPISQDITRIYSQLKSFRTNLDQIDSRLTNVANGTNVINTIKSQVHFTLHFRQTIPQGKNLNNFSSGASIYNLDGKYQNSPLDEQIIYGSMINLVRYKENVYENKENVQFIYQFIMLSSGRIFNRTRWDGNWNAWKEIERVNPKL